jgi:hypothetical protein
MNIGILVCIEIAEPVDHRLRLLRRRGIIKPDQLFAIHALGQYRKIAPYSMDIKWCGQSRIRSAGSSIPVILLALLKIIRGRQFICLVAVAVAVFAGYNSPNKRCN